MCYVTGLTNDVDDGVTVLTSPVIELDGAVSATLTYARWYSNTQGSPGGAQADVFVVQVSGDGGSNWSDLEVVGPTAGSANGEVDGGWFERSFDVTDVVLEQGQLRVRFVAEDASTASVIEAAVDAVRVDAVVCEEPTVFAACDTNTDGGVDFFDLLDYLDLWFAGDAQADFNDDQAVDFFDLLDFLDCWFAQG